MRPMSGKRSVLDNTKRLITPAARAAERAALAAELTPKGCLSSAGWLGAGFVLSCFSPTFYYRAARIPLVFAMGFFFLFALIGSTLQTMGLARGMFQVAGRIWDVHAEGDFPTITIAGGMAEVDAPQPYIIYDQNRTLVALDTTGVLMDIDRERYSQGLLLTRRHLILLTGWGDYSRQSLRDLQLAAGTAPIVLDGDTVTGTMTALGTIATVIGFLVLFLWNSIGRLAVLILIALFFWTAAFLLRKETSFGEIASVGIYSIVPATYLHLLLSQVGVSFLGLFTLLSAVIWLGALFLAFFPRRKDLSPTGLSALFKSERPLRGWRTLLGLPMLAVFSLQIIMGWEGWLLPWGIAFLTMVVLLAVSAWPVIRFKQTALHNPTI
jgi:hypothetical protein